MPMVNNSPTVEHAPGDSAEASKAREFLQLSRELTAMAEADPAAQRSAEYRRLMRRMALCAPAELAEEARDTLRHLAFTETLEALQLIADTQGSAAVARPEYASLVAQLVENADPAQQAALAEHLAAIGLLQRELVAIYGFGPGVTSLAALAQRLGMGEDEVRDRLAQSDAPTAERPLQ